MLQIGQADQVADGSDPGLPDAKQRTAWRRDSVVVAAYRDRYQITDDRTPLGPAPQSTR